MFAASAAKCEQDIIRWSLVPDNGDVAHCPVVGILEYVAQPPICCNSYRTDATNRGLRDIFRERDRSCDFAQARDLVFYGRQIGHRRRIPPDMSRDPRSVAIGEGEMQHIGGCATSAVGDLHEIGGCATSAIAWMRGCAVIRRPPERGTVPCGRNVAGRGALRAPAPARAHTSRARSATSFFIIK